jgi:hypothetical protein
MRLPKSPGAFQTTVIGRRAVSLGEGKQENIEIGRGELVPKDSQ